MQNSRKNGDNTLADALSRRLELLTTTRLAPIDFEAGPVSRLRKAVPRCANRVRSVPVHPGTMSWHEMHSPFPEESAAFLAELLDGDVATADHGGGGCYSTVLCDGLHVAGALHTTHNRAAAWNTFVRVPNVDHLCSVAQARGGSVRVEPSGILGLDRRAVISDPTGASLTIIAGGDDRRTVGAGALGWDELRSIDPVESVRFWCSVFEWTAMPILEARAAQGMLFLNGGRAVASVQQATASEPRSRWLPIATVRGEHFDAAVRKSICSGARIGVAPTAHSLLERVAIIIEPSGLELVVGIEPKTAIAAA